MRLRGRALASVADAGLSSFGNLWLSLAGAQFLGLEDFGVLATLLIVAILTTGVSKVALVDAFTLRWSAADPVQRRAKARLVLGASAAAATGFAAVCIGVAGFLDAAGVLPAAPMVALGLVFPALIVQDALRWIGYAEDDLRSALINTSTWTAGVLVGACLLVAADAVTVSALIGVWGGSAGIAAVVTIARTALVPRLSGAAAWIRESRYIGMRTALDYALTQAMGSGGGLLIAAVAGTAAYGTLRVAQLPLAFVQVGIAGTIALLQPTMVVLVANGSPQRARRLSLVALLGMVAVLAVVTSVAWLAPHDLMAGVFGSAWGDARGLVPVVAVALIGAAASAAYGPFLRATGGLNYEVTVKTLAAPLVLLLIVVGSAALGGLGGALAQAAGAVVLAVFTVVKAFSPVSRPTPADAGHRS
jgi:O-antigen/teichoic acid export membrane protein